MCTFRPPGQCRQAVKLKSRVPQEEVVFLFCLCAAEMQLDAGATVSQAKGVSWRSCKYQVRDAPAVEVCSKQSDSVQRTED